MTQTFNTLDISHLLVVCPRGFANERDVYAIPADLVSIAEELVAEANPSGFAGQTRMIEIDNASGADRSRASLTVQQWSEVGIDYRKMLLCDEAMFASPLYPILSRSWQHA